MSGKLSYERYAWFHGMVASGAFPNSVGLAAHFDISRKQAQRDIEFMRDRLSAPLQYNAGRRGYGYADGSYELPPDLPPPREFIRRNFGVIADDVSTTTTLRFSPAISPLVIEQQWHEVQQTTISEDGFLTMSFPVSGFAEITREILKYGADVEVVEPAELHNAVAKEILRMEKMYR